MGTLAQVQRLWQEEPKTGLKSTWKSSMTSTLYLSWTAKVETTLAHSLPNLYIFRLAQTNFQNFVNFQLHPGISSGWLIKRHILCMWLTNLINSTICEPLPLDFGMNCVVHEPLSVTSGTQSVNVFCSCRDTGNHSQYQRWIARSGYHPLIWLENSSTIHKLQF